MLTRTFLTFILLSQASLAAPVTIKIEPTTTRAIEGHSKVERQRYFAIADYGSSFQKTLRSPQRFHYLTKDLGIKLGRTLGPIRGTLRYGPGVTESTTRPGFANLDLLKKNLAKRPTHPEEKLKAAFGHNLNIAAHGAHNAFPDFLGKHLTTASAKAPHPQHIPQNIAGAAELSATILRHNFTDLTRPAFYEPVNEPHWSFFNDQHFADWHLATMKRVKQDCPKMKIGGLCMSVAYFPDQSYSTWKGMQQFIDNTRGQLDFYSFHAYDYYKTAQSAPQNNLNKITSGLPLEGVLDLLNNHAHNSFGKHLSLVISEQGGYCLSPKDGSQYVGEKIAKQILADAPPKLAKQDFAGELQRRSTVQWVHISSILANTLTFIDHPHSVQKAVPFIIPNTESWNPKYYASLYTPNNYKKGAPLQENFLITYYKLMQGIDGRRIIADSPDPDLQTRAFTHRNTVYTIINNLSHKTHPLTLLGLTRAGATHTLRRLTRGPHLIPSYSETPLANLDKLTIHSRDCLVLVSTYPEPIIEKSLLNERIFYGNKIIQRIEKNTPSLNFTIKTPKAAQAKNAILRLGFNRPPGTDKRIHITLNGHPLQVPIEDSAHRFTTETGYTSTRLIPLSKNLLKEKNTVTITFPDGKPGAIGTAIIRARY